MTKQEAIKALEAGKTLTHRHFTHNEHIKLENGRIVYEDGYSAEPAEFWKYHREESFGDGWNIYKPQNTNK